MSLDRVPMTIKATLGVLGVLCLLALHFVPILGLLGCAAIGSLEASRRGHLAGDCSWLFFRVMSAACIALAVVDAAFNLYEVSQKQELSRPDEIHRHSSSSTHGAHYHSLVGLMDATIVVLNAFIVHRTWSWTSPIGAIANDPKPEEEKEAMSSKEKGRGDADVGCEDEEREAVAV